MDDFDIEQYLEEQVTSKSRDVDSNNKSHDAKDDESNSKAVDNVKDKDDERGRDKGVDRRDREKDPERKKRRSRSRSDSRRRRRRSSRSRSIDRYDRYRRSSRDRSRDRTSRRDKERGEKESRERSEERSSRRDKDNDKAVKETVPVVKAGPTEEEILKEKQKQAEREQKRMEELQEKEMLRRQQEIDDLTRDQRTIFVGQLTAKVTEKHLRDFFDQISKVKNIIMIRDKNTGKHKGFAYVEITDLDQIPNCLLFNEAVPDFQKFPILVRPSEAEKNYLARKDSSLTGPDSRIYIGNIHINITDDALRTVLEQFGPLDTVLIQRDEMGNSKGFAFAKYRLPESAALAMNGLAGMELVGRPLKVGPVLDNGQKVASTGSGGSGGTNVVNWKLDDDDGSKGMYLNAQSRMMLMARLGEGAGIHVPPPVTLPVAPTTPAISGVASRAFVIANMFDPSTETEPNWDLDIKEDVTEECSKFGNVENCYVEKVKPGGLVFVKFSAVESSVKAAQSLNGRFFAGKMITVTYLDPMHYDKIIRG